jgi:hypothetical protein
MGLPPRYGSQCCLPQASWKSKLQLLKPVWESGGALHKTRKHTVLTFRDLGVALLRPSRYTSSICRNLSA